MFASLEQIVSEHKYPCILSRQVKAIVCVFTSTSGKSLLICLKYMGNKLDIFKVLQSKIDN